MTHVVSRRDATLSTTNRYARPECQHFIIYSFHDNKSVSSLNGLVWLDLCGNCTFGKEGCLLIAMVGQYYCTSHLQGERFRACCFLPAVLTNRRIFICNRYYTWAEHDTCARFITLCSLSKTRTLSCPYYASVNQLRGEPTALGL